MLPDNMPMTEEAKIQIIESINENGSVLYET